MMMGGSAERIHWFECFEDPFSVHGTYRSQHAPPFYRMDPTCLAEISNGVRMMAYETSGMRLRFRTDSSSLVVRAVLSASRVFSHMPGSGACGFDLYLGRDSGIRFVPTSDLELADGFVRQNYTLLEPGWKDVTLCFPLCSGIKELSVGLDVDAGIEPAPPYRFTAPIVFYGSSITHGCCASRPGNSYPMILSRMLNADVVNLGFSGSALGEEAMARYIASLDMSVFVMDYDYNAPSAEYLRETHKAFFSIIRSVNPCLPIVMMSRPNYNTLSGDDAARRAVVMATYLSALEAGDRFAFFIDGEKLFGAVMPDCCTVDGIHPNDLGFLRMAEAALPTLSKILSQSTLAV